MAEAGYLLFARVNTLLGASVDTVAAELRAQGWEELPPLSGDAAASPLAAAVASGVRRAFSRDALLADVRSGLGFGVGFGLGLGLGSGG